MGKPWRITGFFLVLTALGSSIPAQSTGGSPARFALHSEVTAVGPDMTSRPETISGVAGVWPELWSGRAIAFAEMRPMNEKHVRWSGEFSSPFVFLSAGSRFLPGAPTDFLRRPYSVASSLDVAPARDVTSAWLSLFPGNVPGLFVLEQERSAGFFYAPDLNTLLAVHPNARAGVIALRRSFGAPDARTDIVTDILFNRRTAEGFASLARHPDTEGLTIETTAERRENSDYKNFATGELYVNRRGRSGFGSVFAGIDDSFFGEIAGEDRGLSGVRLAGAGIALPSARIQLVLRVRLMRESVYGGPENRRAWESIAVGLRSWGKKGRFFAAVESKKHGTRSIEGGGTLRTRWLDLDAGLTAQETGGRLTPSPLFLPGGVEMETRPKFFFGRKSALFARVRSSFLNCTISLGEDFSGRRTALTSAEIRVQL